MKEFKSISRAIRRGNAKVELDTVTQRLSVKKRTSSGRWLEMYSFPLGA